jgi:hypothetical protein
MPSSSSSTAQRRLQAMTVTEDEEESVAMTATETGIVTAIGENVPESPDETAAGARTERPSGCKRNESVRSRGVRKRRRSAKGRSRMPREVTEPL